jgi:hypothetical protein
MLTFTLPGVFSHAVSGNRIAVSVPAHTDVNALAPTFTLSPLAAAVPPSGTTRDFTRPQSYTLTAQDAARADSGHISFEDVQVGAAERGLGDAHQRVRGLQQRRLGHVLQAFLAWTVVNECFHERP